MTRIFDAYRAFRYVSLTMLAFIGVTYVVWLYFALSGMSDLRSAYEKLVPGMGHQDVVRIMGKDVPQIRFEWPKLAHVLSPEEQGRSSYVLVFYNAYYTDPAIYCYFDINDRLVAAHYFD